MPPEALDETDEEFLERLQKAAFDYFCEYSDPVTGLVADTSRPASPASIAVVGFALSCYPIGVERGWIARQDAAVLALRVLRFFWSSEQDEEPDATGHKGFYYHFLDMRTGRRVWNCELSMIDSTLLLAGALTSATYFSASSPIEAEIRHLVESIYLRFDWHWALNDNRTVAQGWKPECGFLQSAWEGYSEATILYVLGLASPANPLPSSSFHGWTATYQWENVFGYEYLYAGPLFIHLFSHAWIDFREIKDAFMREKGSDYFANTRRAVCVHREYGARNPHGFIGYGPNFWGITAGDGPGNEELRESGRDRRFFGYTERGVPFGRDDGTIAPWAMLASLPFSPPGAIVAVRRFVHDHPTVLTGGRLASGFNPSLIEEGGWVSVGHYGLDQGILVMMIENFRSGFVWDLMRSCPYIRSGLKRATFEGGWLSDPVPTIRSHG
jgi:hypothetical protein